MTKSSIDRILVAASMGIVILACLILVLYVCAVTFGFMFTASAVYIAFVVTTVVVILNSDLALKYQSRSHQRKRIAQYCLCGALWPVFVPYIVFSAVRWKK